MCETTPYNYISNELWGKNESVFLPCLLFYFFFWSTMTLFIKVKCLRACVVGMNVGAEVPDEILLCSSVHVSFLFNLVCSCVCLVGKNGAMDSLSWTVPPQPWRSTDVIRNKIQTEIYIYIYAYIDIDRCLYMSGLYIISWYVRTGTIYGLYRKKVHYIKAFTPNNNKQQTPWRRKKKKEKGRKTGGGGIVKMEWVYIKENQEFCLLIAVWRWQMHRASPLSSPFFSPSFYSSTEKEGNPGLIQFLCSSHSPAIFPPSLGCFQKGFIYIYRSCTQRRTPSCRYRLLAISACVRRVCTVYVLPSSVFFCQKRRATQCLNQLLPRIHRLDGGGRTEGGTRAFSRRNQC